MYSQEYDVRELAISVAGRLSEKNPAYVLPALRRYLMQLLTYLDQRLPKFSSDYEFGCQSYICIAPTSCLKISVFCSMDSKCREESARLLGCLIRSCARLILPYIAPVHKVSKK